MGLCDDLRAVEILSSNGDETAKRSWYNRKTGRLFIPVFKTMRARGSRPYDFTLTPFLKHAVDDTLMDSKRNWLVGIGLSAAGRPNPVGSKIRDASAKAELDYNMMHNGKEVLTSAKLVDIKHAQIMYFNRMLIKNNPVSLPRWSPTRSRSFSYTRAKST